VAAGGLIREPRYPTWRPHCRRPDHEHMADKPVDPAVSSAITTATKGQVAADKLLPATAGQSGREAARTHVDAMDQLVKAEAVIEAEVM